MNDASYNKLRIVPVTSEYPNVECLFNIRDEAFPANERNASRDISPYSAENGYVLLAFEVDTVPVGFILFRDCGDNMYYGIYLAIGKEFRNRHYGSHVLKLVLEEYLKGKVFFGCVEALLPEAENYQQRVNRVRFYQRNGLFLLDGIIDGGPVGKYQFICSDPELTYDQLMAKFRSISSLHTE